MRTGAQPDFSRDRKAKPGLMTLVASNPDGERPGAIELRPGEVGPPKAKGKTAGKQPGGRGPHPRGRENTSEMRISYANGQPIGVARRKMRGVNSKFRRPQGFKSHKRPRSPKSMGHEDQKRRNPEPRRSANAMDIRLQAQCIFTRDAITP